MGIRHLIFLSLLIVAGDEVTVDSSIRSSTRKSELTQVKEFHFPKVYRYIRTHIEGNYVWNKYDRGGETYGGVARRIHPEWSGWKHVDAAKPLKTHDRVQAAEHHVLDFYLSIWVEEGFESIEDYDLALNLFDFRIHSSPKTVQRKVNNVLRELGCDPVIIGPDWVTKLPSNLPSPDFVYMLKIERLKLFNYLVTKSPDQRTFYKGWLRRIGNI